MERQTYKVAECAFTVIVPEDKDLDILLPNFGPFICRTREKLVFSLDATMARPLSSPDEMILDSTENEAGNISVSTCVDGYIVRISYDSDLYEHSFLFENDFPKGKAYIDWNDPNAGDVLSTMLRIFFSQMVLFQEGISLHASAVICGGKAFLFMGPSGAGKSTHSKMWLKAFEGCELLNDDNPTVRLIDEVPVAFGTPWSGKTPCYRNLSAPVGGVARIRQADHNHFISRKEVKAFITILPGCSAIHKDELIHAALCDDLVRITEKIPVGILECLPEEEAARLCRSSLESSGC